MNEQQNLEELDILTIISFIMQIQLAEQNSHYIHNIHLRFDAVMDRLQQIENKLDKILEKQL